MTEYDFAGQYQQRPIPLGGAIVKLDWLKFYEPHEVPEHFMTKLQSWDTANKATDLSDFSVCTTWGIYDNRYYLLHFFRKRLNFPELKVAVHDLAREYRPISILIEDKASGTPLIQDLHADGLRNVKPYLMLQNRIYRGEITHKGKSYPGEHPAIIDQPLWDEVQAVLAQNRVERATGARAKHPSVLGGLVFDATGERLTPTYAIKKGTRYRYYVSSSLVREAKRNRAGRWRIPAGDLEALVINRVREFFCDPSALLDITDRSGLGKRQLIERGRQVAEELGTDAPDKAKATLMALTCRITIHSDRIDIALSHGRIAAMLAGASIDLAAQPQIAVSAPDDLMTLRAPARLQRIGRGMRMIVEGVNDKAEADPSLLRVLTRAHNIQERLSQDTDLTVHDVAREERVTAAYIYALLHLPWLAPDITTAIVNGRQPHQLSAKTLMRRVSRLPADWAEQRALLEF